MPTKTSRGRRLTEQERDERRQADRQRLKEASEQLLSSDGWARWVRARSMFHSYSASNSMLLALQFHQRGIAPERVAGFRTWLRLGRVVRKGERAMRVLAPVSIKKRDQPTGEETDERRVFFKSAFVFSISQTDQLPGADPLPLEAPRAPLTGDSHAYLLPRLHEFTRSLGYTASFRPIPGSTGGWCDARAKEIVVDSDQPANGQVRTFVHETVHALGVDYEKYNRAQTEVIVDATTLVVLGTVGLDTSGETVPYIAGWGESGALEAITEFAHLIDGLARQVERAILDPRDDRHGQQADELVEVACGQP